MMTAAKLEANRRNAQLSTGPRSTKGRARSATNATTHGILSRCAVLQGEDGAMMDSLRDSLEQELQPATAVERMLTDHVVACMWRLRRVYAMETALVAERVHDAQRIARIGEYGEESVEREAVIQQRALGLAFQRASDHFERLSRYEQNIDRSMRRSLADLRDLQRERATIEVKAVEDEVHGEEDRT